MDLNKKKLKVAMNEINASHIKTLKLIEKHAHTREGINAGLMFMQKAVGHYELLIKDATGLAMKAMLFPEAFAKEVEAATRKKQERKNNGACKN